jgi:hypothetical protein
MWARNVVSGLWSLERTSKIFGPVDWLLWRRRWTNFNLWVHAWWKSARTSVWWVATLKIVHCRNRWYLDNLIQENTCLNRWSVYLGMFHVSARVGIYSCLYTPQKATRFLKILFTKAKFEGHKWCKLKFWKKHRWLAQIDEALRWRRFLL